MALPEKAGEIASPGRKLNQCAFTARNGSTEDFYHKDTKAPRMMKLENEENLQRRRRGRRNITLFHGVET